MPRFTLIACVSFTTAYQLSVRAPSVRAPAARALRATPDDTTPAEPVDNTPDAVSEAKVALLQAIAGTDRGFKKDKSMAASVRNAIHALSDAAKDLTPVPLDGDWTLLWTDAPDITGLGSSLPFADRKSVV